MDAPSMVQRSGDTLIVRSVVSGNQLFLDHGQANSNPSLLGPVNYTDECLDEAIDEESIEGDTEDTPTDLTQGVKDEELPQCKIKRNYSCNSCTYFTQNPRLYLTHLRDKHGEKIVINECKHCLYASRHYQKLVRHMKMVHGSTDGLEEHHQSRKRAHQMIREIKKRRVTSEDIIPPTESEEALSFGAATNTHSVGELNKLLKCSVCDFTTLSRSQLTDHERNDHIKTKFFRCSKCSYVTHIKARFSKHVKYHSMPMIKCVMCDFRTPYKWNLDRHMKNHGGTGPFKCAACNFTADIKQSLTVHEMNHHVPPVGHASGMSMHRRKNKVGGTDLPDDPADEMMYRDNPDHEMNFDESLHLISNNNNRDIKPYNSDMVNDSGVFSSSMSDTTVSPPSGVKKIPRPIPNLIPIQNASTAALNLSVNRKNDAPPPMAQAMADLCANSSSALKDFASLFAGGKEILTESCSLKNETPPQMSPSSTNSFKKKHASFFDKLREKCVTNSGVGTTMTCACGHVSKCLSEALIHQEACKKSLENSRKSTSPINLSMNLGSTRCQICRHRCKSSADLIAHMQTCAEHKSTGGESMEDSVSEIENSDRGEGHDEDLIDDASSDNQKEPHPMENKVFVWNRMPEHQDQFISQEQQPPPQDVTDSVSREDQNSFCGVETAPGYGEITKPMQKIEDQSPAPTGSCLKKVFKCPHCSFWASTASRFHVHIVGHLNKKPFECSLCSYRSNWRWDITKHIRLKTIRDPSHKTARVLMNDETGRRNYTKYNKYITLMKVTEEDGNLKLMKSGEMTPNQEAALQPPNLNPAPKHNPPPDFSMLKKLNQNENLQVAPVLQDAPPFVTIAFKNLEKNNLLSVQDLPFMMTTAGITGETLAETLGALTAKTTTNQDNDSKKTLFKCKKCQFKHPNRETVLAHVKRHYEEAGLPVDNNISLSDKKPILTLTDDLKQALMGQKCEPLAAPQMPAAAMVLIPSNNNNNNNNENGELDEASSGGTTVIPGWRGATASYRCGHCHQVSNWKHVIQRHCRLKHNGDIQIELMEPNGKVALRKITSSTQVPAPVPVNSAAAPIVATEKEKASPSGDGGGRKSMDENSSAIKCHSGPDDVSKINSGGQVFKIFVARPGNEGSSDPVVKNIKTDPDSSAGHLDENLSSVEQCETEIRDQAGTSGQLSQIEASEPQAGPSSASSSSSSKRRQQQQFKTVRSKRYNCHACPYVTDSKSQFIYHKSFHKPRGEQFKCTHCTYNVTKKHLLNQHLKLHQRELGHESSTSKTPAEVKSPILNEEKDVIDDRVLYFCDKCPARFFSERDVKNHGRMHTTGIPSRCNLCSFSTRQDTILHTHNQVHSDQYQKETKALEEKLKISADHPKPALTWTKDENSQIVWIIVGGQCQKTGASEDDQEAQKEQKITRNCPHCPFVVISTAGNEGNGEKQLEDHIQHHVGSTSGKYRVVCGFCNFATNTEKALKEHTKWHFAASKKRHNNVEFFTKFDNVQIYIETAGEEDANMMIDKSEDDSEIVTKTIFDEQKTTVETSRSPLAEDNKIFINLKTGEIIKKSTGRL